MMDGNFISRKRIGGIVALSFLQFGNLSGQERPNIVMILADDMGLGKTLQTITLLVSDQGKGSSIIVCPASLIYNWQHELELFASNLRIQVVAGNAKERKELIEQYTSYDVLITSYDLLRRDLEIYEGCKFFYQILDEAQYIKNHMTMNAKAVKQINAAYRLALTGTPIENSLSELWSIFDYLMPGYLYSYTRFRKQFEMPIMKNEDAAARNRLRKMTAPFLLRRSKSQVLSDLPEKDEKTIYSGMEDEQRKLYLAAHKQLVDQLQGIDSAYYEKNKIFILSQLTKLRQICCHPALCYDDYQGSSAKLEACMELVQRAVKGKHKGKLCSIPHSIHRPGVRPNRPGRYQVSLVRSKIAGALLMRSRMTIHLYF